MSQDERAKRPLTFYLSGPMSGHEHYNFPLFHRVADALREQGLNILNPTDKETKPGTDKTDYNHIGSMTVGECFQEDFRMIDQADGIAVLPGWENSTGAKAEFLAATLMWKLRCKVVLSHDGIYLQELPHSVNISTSVVTNVYSAYVKRPKANEQPRPVEE